MTTLITGAPGNIGTHVVPLLQQQGSAVRVAARNVARAQSLLGEQTDIVRFDFTDPTTFRQTFAGATRLLLVRPPALGNVSRDIAPALYAALGAGVEHVVFVSVQGVEQSRMIPHNAIERLLKRIGVGYTFLRCGFFMQNLATTHRAEIRDRDEIAVPVGEARTAFVDTRDIAAVAARTLTEPGHAGAAYTLTGKEALTYYEVAAILTSVLQRPIRYTNPPAPVFTLRQMQAGMSPGFALVVTALYSATRMGNAATPSDDLPRLLGRAPTTLRQFAEDYAHVWEHDPA